jgi:hypothetical protein
MSSAAWASAQLTLADSGDGRVIRFKGARCHLPVQRAASIIGRGHDRFSHRTRLWSDRIPRRVAAVRPIVLPRGKP